MTQVGSTPQSPVDGRYLLDAALERWGVGESWQARDKNFRNRPVVIEFLPAELADLALERSHDLRVQRALKHPCVLPVINQGVHQGRAWVAFDGVDGVPLARFIDEQRRARAQVDLATARDLFDKVLDGVSAAHEAPTAVLHGCLSARSVIVKPGVAVKVFDFALGPFASADVLGASRAPELARAGEAPSIASDVYALGVLLADLLMPQNVGDARKALDALLAAMLRDGGAQAGRMQRTDAPPTVWEVVTRAVRREPAARWDDVASMRKALDAAWSSAPLVAPAPVASSHLRPPTVSMPAIRREPVAPLPNPLPAAAFSNALPPVQAPFAPPQPAFTAPAPFVAPQPMAPAPSTAWDSSPVSPDAWATVKPAGRAQMNAALLSAWDPPAQMPPVAAHASAWDAGVVTPSWEAPPSYAPPLPVATPRAGAHASGDDDWEDETRASAEHPLRGYAPSAIAPSTNALQARLANMERQESTMALDLDSLALAAGLAAPVSTVPPSRVSSDDWREAPVVLDTGGALDDEDDEIDGLEPGSRTQVAQPPGPVLDSMETLRPMQRPAGLEPFLPRAPGGGPVDAESTFVATGPLVVEAVARPPTMAPRMPQHASMGMALPPVSERTMAIDTSAPMISPTLQAPMGMMAHARPPAPTPFQAPPAASPSKTPIVVAVVVALILIGVALAVVALRR